MFSIIGKTNIDFVGKRHIGFVVSALFIALGLAAIVRIAQHKAAMAIDFAGGSSVTLILEKAEPLEKVREALHARFPDAELQQVAGGPTYLIRVHAASAEVGKTSAIVVEQMAKAFPANKVKEASSEEVGPAVSKSLRQKALWALMVSMLCITIYIAFRFDFRFAVGAFFATIHDVLAVLGIMVFLDKEFSLLIVTALLTLAGYSLTDTVVVFDRIRENMRGRRGDSFTAIVNDSINETLSRTLNTSMTVLLTVGVLFVMGGEVVRDFSLALILGVLIGTYSSIFVASPLVVEWNLRSPSRR
jgi:preprotein translocase subunit SecF